jgi:hypothetical protein
LPIKSTIVEKYLEEVRGINSIESTDIRYHPKVHTGKDMKQKYAPAMLSIGRDKDGKVQCVQATYLDEKTTDKADFDVKKRTYASPSGAMVSLQNNAVSSTKNTISFIAEGTETGLSIKDAVKNSDVFVTLGKSNFTKIDPDKVSQKIVFCLDNDGEKSFMDNTINKAAERLINSGKEVFIAIPEQINKQKTDFNDVAKHNGNQVVKDVLNRAITYNEWKDNVTKNQAILDKNDLNKMQFIDKVTNKTNEINYNAYNFMTKNNEISSGKIMQVKEKSAGIKTADLHINTNLSQKQNIMDIQKILSKTDREI